MFQATSFVQREAVSASVLLLSSETGFQYQAVVTAFSSYRAVNTLSRL
jgi:hypothetical protein